MYVLKTRSSSDISPEVASHAGNLPQNTNRTGVSRFGAAGRRMRCVNARARDPSSEVNTVRRLVERRRFMMNVTPIESRLLLH